jgi:hypothetical protein
MNFSSITGVLLVVAAVVWLGGFIPGWVKRGQEIEDIRQVKQQIVRQVRQASPAPKQSKQVSTAHAAMRLSSLRRLLGVMSLAGLFVGAFAQLANLGLVAAVAFILAVVSMFAGVVARKKQLALLAESAQSRGRVASYRAAYQTAFELGGSQPEIADRSWTPRELPAPMHVGHVGTLEQPELAQVTKLPIESETRVARPEEQVAGANLDEILRRRRAI